VENASLLPWLSGTALLHANIVLKKRSLLAQWVLLLSIITFGMSLLGTFLVRSGALVSVHSFASDPQRGLFILFYITLLLGWALSLFASRGYRMASEGQMEPLSREGIIVINNLFLLTACATILLGTLYPMLAEALAGKSISVGAPYFNITALPLLTIPLFFAGLAPFMPWNHALLRSALRKSLPCFLAALAAAAIVIATQMPDALLAAAGIALSVWLSAASVRWLLLRQSAKNAYSVFLGHLGAALVIAGITGAGLWKQEHEQWMSVGQSVTLAGYELTLTDIQSGNSANYQATSAAFDVKASGQLIATLTPEYRVYSIRNSGSSVVSIYPSLLGDLYGVVGEADKDRRKISVRLYYNPMIGLLWAGFVLMALGGLTAIIQGITKGTKGTRHEP
jgi:cytochrome c-type biogenesis protein CcmF